MEDTVLLLGRWIECRREASGVDIFFCGGVLASARGRGGISKCDISLLGSCTGDILTDTEESGVGTALVS